MSKLKINLKGNVSDDRLGYSSNCENPNGKPTYSEEQTTPFMYRGPTPYDYSDAWNFANNMIKKLMTTDKNLLNLICDDGEEDCRKWKAGGEPNKWRTINNTDPNTTCTSDDVCAALEATNNISNVTTPFCIKKNNEESGNCGFVEQHSTNGEDIDPKFDTRYGRSVINSKSLCEKISRFDSINYNHTSTDDLLHVENAISEEDDKDGFDRQRMGDCIPRTCTEDVNGIKCGEKTCGTISCFEDKHCHKNNNIEDGVLLGMSGKCDQQTLTCEQIGELNTCETNDDCIDPNAPEQDHGLCNPARFVIKGIANPLATAEDGDDPLDLDKCTFDSGVYDEETQKFKYPKVGCNKQFTTGSCYNQGPCPITKNISQDPNTFTSYLIWKDDAGKCGGTNYTGNGGPQFGQLREGECLQSSSCVTCDDNTEDCKGEANRCSCDPSTANGRDPNVDCEGNSTCIDIGKGDNKASYRCSINNNSSDDDKTIGKCVYGNDALRTFCSFPQCRGFIEKESDYNKYNTLPPFSYDINKDTCHIQKSYCDIGSAGFGIKNGDGTNMDSYHLWGGTDTDIPKKCTLSKDDNKVLPQQSSDLNRKGDGCQTIGNNGDWWCDVNRRRGWSDGKEDTEGICVGPDSQCELDEWYITTPEFITGNTLFSPFKRGDCKWLPGQEDGGSKSSNEKYKQTPHTQKIDKPKLTNVIKDVMDVLSEIDHVAYIPLEYTKVIVNQPVILPKYAGNIGLRMIIFNDGTKTIGVSLEDIQSEYPNNITQHNGVKSMKITRTEASTNTGLRRLFGLLGSK